MAPAGPWIEGLATVSVGLEQKVDQPHAPWRYALFREICYNVLGTSRQASNGASFPSPQSPRKRVDVMSKEAEKIEYHYGFYGVMRCKYECGFTPPRD